MANTVETESCVTIESMDSENGTNAIKPIPLLGYEKIKSYLKAAFLKCYAFSSVAVFTCFLIYWAYGGVIAFSLFILTLTGIVTGISYNMQDFFLYFPEQPSHSRIFVALPSMHNLPFENIFIKSMDGVTIHGYFIHQADQKTKCETMTLVYLHGNAGNIGHRLVNAEGLYRQLKCNILMVEYRGYGKSVGTPSEEGLCMDAMAALDYLFLRTDINQRRIVIFGRSLGGAVAIDLLARPEYSTRIWCLIVENTFTSIPDIAFVLLKWKFLKELPIFCFKNKYLSHWKIARVSNPTFFITGLSDNLVPPTMMVKLHDNCGANLKHMIMYKSGSHNDTWKCPGYYDNLVKFLFMANEYLPSPSAVSNSCSSECTSVSDIQCV